MASSFDATDREFQALAEDTLKEYNNMESQFVELFQDLKSEEKGILNSAALENELEEIGTTIPIPDIKPDDNDLKLTFGSFNDYPVEIPKPIKPNTSGGKPCYSEAALNSTSMSGGSSVKNDSVDQKKRAKERKAEKAISLFDTALLRDIGIEELGEKIFNRKPTNCFGRLKECQQKAEMFLAVVDKHDAVVFDYNKNVNELQSLAQKLKGATTPVGDIKELALNESEDDEREAAMNQLLTQGFKIINSTEF